MGIHSSFFAENGNESSKERKERIKKSVDDAFSKYDKDNNGCLTIKEFLEWAETSPEVQRLFKLFSKMDNDLTKSSESGAVSMINVTHDTHGRVCLWYFSLYKRYKERKYMFIF